MDRHRAGRHRMDRRGVRAGPAVQAAGLPPLVGFLAAGFVLNLFGIASGEMLPETGGSRNHPAAVRRRSQAQPADLRAAAGLGVTGLHMALTVLILGTVLLILALLKAPSFSDNGLYQIMLIAFALSFSSTVFVVKVLEDKGETAALHGRIAVGILIVQDLAAVAFITFSVGTWPSSGRCWCCCLYRRDRCCYLFCRKSAMASSWCSADCSSPWAALSFSSWSD